MDLWAKPESILSKKERIILLEVYENPSKRYDTFLLTEMLHFPDLLNLSNVSKLVATRGTPEYASAFKETIRNIESLVEKGWIDGDQRRDNQDTWGMYYTELKIKYKGKQEAIREKRRAEQNLLGDFEKL